MSKSIDTSLRAELEQIVQDKSTGFYTTDFVDALEALVTRRVEDASAPSVTPTASSKQFDTLCPVCEQELGTNRKLYLNSELGTYHLICRQNVTKQVEEARLDELGMFTTAAPEVSSEWIDQRVAELTANATPQEKNGANHG